MAITSSPTMNTIPFRIQARVLLQTLLCLWFVRRHVRMISNPMTGRSGPYRVSFRSDRRLRLDLASG
jgi:hypothetical protein